MLSECESDSTQNIGDQIHSLTTQIFVYQQNFKHFVRICNLFVNAFHRLLVNKFQLALNPLFFRLELLDFYESKFGKLSELPCSSYETVSGSGDGAIYKSAVTLTPSLLSQPSEHVQRVQPQILEEIPVILNMVSSL